MQQSNVANKNYTTPTWTPTETAISLLTLERSATNQHKKTVSFDTTHPTNCILTPPIIQTG